MLLEDSNVKVRVPDAVEDISVGDTVFVSVESNVKGPDTLENIPIWEYYDVLYNNT